jgi:hypothetical protein
VEIVNVAPSEGYEILDGFPGGNLRFDEHIGPMEQPIADIHAPLSASSRFIWSF